MELAVGTIVSGKVTTITKFGAFVSLGDNKSGLVHISEVAAAFVSDVHDFLTEGQEVQVKILAISPEGKINLSIKQALPAAQEPKRAYRPQNAPQRNVQRSAPSAVPTAPAAPVETSFVINKHKDEEFVTYFSEKIILSALGAKIPQQDKA